MPPIASVSHLQYAVVAVTICLAADLLEAAVPERCWTHACPGVEPLALALGLEITCPWLLVLRWYDVLLQQIHAQALVLLRRPLSISSLLLHC